MPISVLCGPILTGKIRYCTILRFYSCMCFQIIDNDVVGRYCVSIRSKFGSSTYFYLAQVTVSTQLTDLRTYLDHVTKITNFKCLTPPEALRGECNYLCATLYARSIFGEHVLGNLCLEKPADGAPVSGHVRIRAKTQGMAVTMGDKVRLS